MKNNLSIILSAVALIVAVVFGILYMSSDKSAGSSVPTDSSDSTAVAAEGAIVYIDLDRIFQENPSMNSVYPKESRYILEPFCIADANIEFFDLSQEPIYRENFVIGNRKEQKKGFEISVSCIGCGTCERICPQQCISSGTPYEIHQNHCLHCGLCFENCPVKAVKRRGE